MRKVFKRLGREALKDLDSLFDLASESYAFFLARGNTLYCSGNEYGAKQFLLAGLYKFYLQQQSNARINLTDAMRDGLAMSAVQLGDCFRAAENFDHALIAYEFGTEIAPRFATTRFYCGIVEEEDKGNLSSALQYYRSILDTNCLFNEEVTEPVVWFKIGYCHGELKEYTEAIHCYENALRLDRSDFDIYYNLGRCYLMVGDYSKCLEIYRTALHAFPDILPKHREIINERIQLSERCLTRAEKRPSTIPERKSFGPEKKKEDALDILTGADTIKDRYIFSGADLTRRGSKVGSIEEGGIFDAKGTQRIVNQHGDLKGKIHGPGVFDAADDQVIRDKNGTKIGKIVTNIWGERIIKDKWGRKIGEIKKNIWGDTKIKKK